MTATHPSGIGNGSTRYSGAHWAKAHVGLDVAGASGLASRVLVVEKRHAEPIVVNVRRGAFTESTHVVHAVVATPDEVLCSWGEADRVTMPRSAIKSIQVLPLITLGAAAAFDVSDDEIALACSSHGAEDVHLSGVEGWLERIGLDSSALECGPSEPITKSAAQALYASGQVPTALHNCCSGKHAGFLTLAQHLGEQPEFRLPGYLHPDHGVQKIVRDFQSELTGIDLRGQTPVVDGCGIPVYRFPLVSLAQAMARLVTPEAMAEGLRESAARVTSLLPARAHLVSGTGRAEHILTDAASEPVILKGGAEGVFMGALPDRGIGLALKCEDGNLRGVAEAMGALLYHLEATAELASVNSPVFNAAGAPVGDVSVALPEN